MYRGKINLIPSDKLNLLSDDATNYRKLSDKTIIALAAQCEYLSWSTRYTDNVSLDYQQIRDNAYLELFTEVSCIMLQLRNNGCVLQQSTDEGNTWDDLLSIYDCVQPYIDDLQSQITDNASDIQDNLSTITSLATMVENNAVIETLNHNNQQAQIDALFAALSGSDCCVPLYEMISYALSDDDTTFYMLNGVADGVTLTGNGDYRGIAYCWQYPGTLNDGQTKISIVMDVAPNRIVARAGLIYRLSSTNDVGIPSRVNFGEGLENGFLQPTDGDIRWVDYDDTSPQHNPTVTWLIKAPSSSFPVEDLDICIYGVILEYLPIPDDDDCDCDALQQAIDNEATIRAEEDAQLQAQIDAIQPGTGGAIDILTVSYVDQLSATRIGTIYFGQDPDWLVSSTFVGTSLSLDSQYISINDTGWYSVSVRLRARIASNVGDVAIGLYSQSVGALSAIVVPAHRILGTSILYSHLITGDAIHNLPSGLYYPVLILPPGVGVSLPDSPSLSVDIHRLR